MRAMMTVILLLAAQSVFATPIESDMIEVDGNFQKREEQIDTLKKVRAKLEKQNEMMMKKRIETMRYQQELALMKKMQKMFAENMKSLNEVE
ncbi:MAG: hypothetical protein COW00_13035 [Bdellovibrio sp. CG12_big_fil_rev_8_21_14_0_65_39_13]|nr:MAG: hypothetical protein COW78_05355 [Bdellovibrio sp. CG22_combo_CG10-13_8_21_14_all_39_27]PIQ59004.1 MAG: hypothetical protein COW00_13035 [Bdellovibrio sp. CG12_big_fil_rev_8_21_14_0_65_39_13]PIR33434.1 MAG: hypothetical protein COV37_16305 [Bdellovibrio sp. CG11_big_fil_rev_8_21_14_0_20_39_38]